MRSGLNLRGRGRDERQFLMAISECTIRGEFMEGSGGCLGETPRLARGTRAPRSRRLKTEEFHRDFRLTG